MVSKSEKKSVCVRRTRCDGDGEGLSGCVVSLLLIGQQPGQGGDSTPRHYLLLDVRHAAYFHHNINVADLKLQLVWVCSSLLLFFVSL